MPILNSQINPHSPAFQENADALRVQVAELKELSRDGGETVILLWGLFDSELYIEFEGERSGPYYPISGPIPLHRYRTFKRGKADERADRIRALANQIGLPLSLIHISEPTRPY